MDIVKVFENNMDLLVVNTKENEKDWEFLNGLWQYVLISKNISRTLPKCLYCGYKGEFCFEGFGAIKKVGNGIMYIPDSNDKLYMIPDIIFHYLYIHNMEPTKTYILFRDNSLKQIMWSMYFYHRIILSLFIYNCSFKFLIAIITFYFFRLW